MSAWRTLLLTDLVGSTHLNEAVGDDAMALLWRAHDDTARELIATWKGQEIARSDGFLVIFQDTNDALAFASAYHDALLALSTPMKARIGVHAGPVSLRENSELDRLRGAPSFEIDGVSLPIVARVMATAVGGQTLLTEHAAAALGSTAWRVKSHGHWRLNGIREPIELFEAAEDDRPFEPPPDAQKSYRVVRSLDEWVPARAIPNNLPAERDSFVGRGDALRILDELIDGPTRLVTLLGMGGIGKTRLALRHARLWLGNYPGGAWFCDLSTARDVDGIVTAVSHALDVEPGKGDAIERIAATVAARGPCLVVLDNFEQVARCAQATLGTWLERAPEAKFIATSREVLGIAGEQVHLLAPLGVTEATELFMRRAASASRHLTNLVNLQSVEALVKLLDGLPLAIELAAARSRVLSPSMLLERMNERFTLLAARVGRLDRQMTLRSTLDWSWDLLSETEKAALAQFSVFEGGFTLTSFEAVFLFADGDTQRSPLDLLHSLLDKSLVRQVGSDRFDLLRTVQDYASQHLEADGRFEGSGLDARRAAEQRHGDFFASLSEEQVTRSRGVDLDNLSLACRRACDRGDEVVATQTLALAWAALELRGPFSLGLDLASRVLAIPGLSRVSRAHHVRGAALRALGRTQEAHSSFESALDAARVAGDRVREAEALSSLGTLSANAFRTDEARAYLFSALTLAQSTQAHVLECTVLNSLGGVNETLGLMEAARHDYEAALALARRIGNRRWEGGVLGNLGNVQYAQGQIADASASYEAGLAIARQLGNKKWEANALCNLGLMQHLQGDSDAARQHLEGSLQLAREMGHARLEAIVLCNLGIAEEASSLTAAQSLQESALAVAGRLADRRSQGQILGYLGVLHCKRGYFDLGFQLLQEGKEHLAAIANETDLAFLLCQCAQGHALAGHFASARSALEEAKAIARGSKGGETFEFKSAMNRVESLLARERTTAP